MTVILNTTRSTEYMTGRLAFLLFSNNFDYTDIAKPSEVDVLERTISDTDFCMKMAESSLSEEWENEDDDYWNSFI